MSHEVRFKSTASPECALQVRDDCGLGLPSSALRAWKRSTDDNPVPRRVRVALAPPNERDWSAI
jgi:hypothetical protein